MYLNAGTKMPVLNYIRQSVCSKSGALDTVADY